MVRAWLVVVLLAGCDRVLGLTTLAEDGRAGDTGMIADASSCDLTHFAAMPHVFEGVAQQVSVAPDRSFAVVLDSGTVYMQMPAEGTNRKEIPTLNGSWLYPAMAPDSHQLYMYNVAATRVYSTTYTGTLWTGAVGVTSIATTSLPGALGALPSGERRIVVKEGTEFREYAQTGGGAWMPAQFTRSLMDLTGLDTGMIYFPSLSADASTLLFVVNGSGTDTDGIWYSQRTDFTLANNFSTTTSSSYGLLIPAAGTTFATPQLVGCQVYATVNQQFVRYDP